MSSTVASLPTHERLMFLRSRLACRKPRRTTLFVVPWINVVLLLFAFHVVQSQRVLSPGIMMTLPAVPFSGGAPIDAEVVSVLRTGAVFFHDQRVPMENLVAALRSARERAPRPTLLIEADGEVAHKLLAGVYSAAQMAGYRDVVLATRLPDAPGAP